MNKIWGKLPDSPVYFSRWYNAYWQRSSQCNCFRRICLWYEVPVGKTIAILIFKSSNTPVTYLSYYSIRSISKLMNI